MLSTDALLLLWMCWVLERVEADQTSTLISEVNLLNQRGSPWGIPKVGGGIAIPHFPLWSEIV